MLRCDEYIEENKIKIFGYGKFAVQLLNDLRTLLLNAFMGEDIQSVKRR